MARAVSVIAVILAAALGAIDAAPASRVERAAGTSQPTPVQDRTYFDKGRVGTLGATCVCPSGKRYRVGDMNNNCQSFACNGGVIIESSKTCSKHLPAEHQHRGVNCAPLPSLDALTGCGKLTGGTPGSGMGGCSQCGLANPDPEAYDWTSSAKPTACNPTSHTSSGGCYDWWGISSVSKKYAGLRAFCDAHGAPDGIRKLRQRARKDCCPGNSCPDEAACKAKVANGRSCIWAPASGKVPWCIKPDVNYAADDVLPAVQYKKFQGRWEKVGRSSKYKRTTSVSWSSTFSKGRTQSFANSLESSSSKTSSTSLEFAFGSEIGVTTGASVGVESPWVDVEVSTEISTSLSASASTTNGQEHTFAEASAAEWGRAAETTFSNTRQQTDSLECESASCENGSLYLWTITGFTDVGRKDVTRACQFACVPHTSKMKSPKCPVEHCGNAACTCCTTNNWAKSKVGIPVCGVGSSVHVNVGKGVCQGHQTQKFIDAKTLNFGKHACQAKCIGDSSCTGYGVSDNGCYTYHGGRITGSKTESGARAPLSLYNDADCYSYTRA